MEIEIGDTQIRRFYPYVYRSCVKKKKKKPWKWNKYSRNGIEDTFDVSLLIKIPYAFPLLTEYRMIPDNFGYKHSVRSWSGIPVASKPSYANFAQRTKIPMFGSTEWIAVTSVLFFSTRLLDVAR